VAAKSFQLINNFIVQVNNLIIVYLYIRMYINIWYVYSKRSSYHIIYYEFTLLYKKFRLPIKKQNVNQNLLFSNQSYLKRFIYIFVLKLNTIDFIFKRDHFLISDWQRLRKIKKKLEIRLDVQIRENDDRVNLNSPEDYYSPLNCTARIRVAVTKSTVRRAGPRNLSGG